MCGKCMKEHIENLIAKEQVGFRSPSSCTDNINILQIILSTVRTSDFRFICSLAGLKDVDSVNRMSIWCVLRRRDIQILEEFEVQI